MARILLVDNDETYRERTRELLELKGHAVSCASNPSEAKRLIESGRIDLAVIDIRLRHDDDEKDISGLTLAEETSATVPKIIVTQMPDYSTVRASLGACLGDGEPLAIGYVAKEEGPDALMETIGLALSNIIPALRNNLLKQFQIRSMVDLRGRITGMGSEQATKLLLASHRDTAEQLATLRDAETARALRFQMLGLISSSLSVILTLTAAGLFLAGMLTAGVATLVLSATTSGARMLLAQSEEAAHKRLADQFRSLENVNRVEAAVAICEAIQSPSQRDYCRRELVDHLIRQEWTTR